MSELPYANRPLRVGVQLQPQHADYVALRRAVDAAEEAGVDVIFTWDHFFPLGGDRGGKHFECWTMLAAWAEQTERVELSALVTCNSYRNPDLLADMARTVDHISGGRLILGIGAGWFEKDYDEYGYEFGDAPARLRALRADLPRIEARLAKLNPPPLRDMPILIGGSGEKVTLKLVARHADLWHGFGDAETFARKNEVLLGHCADQGRDPSEIERTWGIHDDVLEHVDDLVDAGVQHVIVGVGGDGKGYDLGVVRELVAWRDRRNAQAA